MTNEELALLIQQGHTEYIPQLWDNLYRLIYKLCYAMYRKNSDRFSHYGITADDVLQQSYFGFLAAVKAYSPDKGFKLTSYLHYHLVNCVRPLLTKDALNKSESLNVLVGEEENTEKQELLPDEHSTEPFDNVEQQSVYAELHALVNGLSDERQRSIIEQLYFSGKSQVQVGAEMNLSPERIRVLKNAAFRELRKPKNRKRLSELSPYQHKSLSRFKVTFSSEVEDYVERLERISNLSPLPSAVPNVPQPTSGRHSSE